MSIIERVFHSVLFEVLAVTFSIIGLSVFTDHEVMSLSGMMIVVATMAMTWNFIFNWLFDHAVPGDKEKRPLKVRVIHVSLFEIGLLFFTVPVMAYILNIGIIEALIMDLGVTVFITIYAFSYNLAYDHARAFIVRQPTVSC
ncbi:MULTISPECIES: PACE efflux transporter [unclassified Shewanella]|uniref:PACE efflux transporter n=1 Tax=unclassified Shewanella TaxID=196818 RepID=UPI001BBD46BB|nr:MULTISPECIES: PACE efflux transporter [unclassified Shewanella]GIU05392.1 membrane protein [Shewanella sp. MBTL60-112-B1]GIU24046.1 membrane protein [Shewanella sp. MBTL60-112-B2]